MLKPVRNVLWLLFFAASLSIAADYGPSIGSKLPEFEAADQNGNIHTLHSLLGPKGALILFFRSADW